MICPGDLTTPLGLKQGGGYAWLELWRTPSRLDIADIIGFVHPGDHVLVVGLYHGMSFVLTKDERVGWLITVELRGLT